MKIEIKRIANGLLVEFTCHPTSGDPLAQRPLLGVAGAAGQPPLGGTFFAHDGTDLMGLIAERIDQEYGFQGESK